ncbi:Coatomer subunit epsilon-2 [Hibiscus syriacus]|uniref:Coatomer subunit epsilon-2 n=1 Tax=Hibiscus syriacus TaxID=106335 RepID=A0A6A3B6T2_HIBSY|nr:Coatomer subunit epsilon-2 [Hibiscus syriacus]
MAGNPDHLFSLRNDLYLCSYQVAINNSDIPHLSADDAVERDCIVYRSYIALGNYQLVISEIDSSAATPLQAVKLLALYLSNPHDKESTISSLKEWLADPAIGNNAILRLIAGTVSCTKKIIMRLLNTPMLVALWNYHDHDCSNGQPLSRVWPLLWRSLAMEGIKDGRVGNGGKGFVADAFLQASLLGGGMVSREMYWTAGQVMSAVLSRVASNLHVLNVQIFIKMHRSDYTERQLRVMQQIDEDHTLTQLANAWLNLAVGGSKIQEAYLISKISLRNIL